MRVILSCGNWRLFYKTKCLCRSSPFANSGFRSNSKCPENHSEIDPTLLRRRRITVEHALQAIDVYLQTPVRFVEVELTESMDLADELGLYAYDAHLLRCATKYHLPLLTLDIPLREAAKKVEVLEV
jgi:predicted nucleic acid-binding protein